MPLSCSTCSRALGPAHVVGHSFGGLVARAAAIRDPAAFRSLTLLDSGPAALPGTRAESVRTLRPVLVEGGKEAVWELCRRDTHQLVPRTSPC